MEPEIRTLVDRAELGGLIDRYMITLDTADGPGRDVGWYRTMFTDDVRMTFPVGAHRGVSGLPEFQRAATVRWKVTHHLSANHVVDVDGDRAGISAQLLATHVEHDSPAGPQRTFHIGGRYRADAVRTPAGWRISDLSFVVVWSEGEGRPS